MVNQNHLSEEEPSDSSRTPLISIGVAIFSVLMVPVFLYSVGPEGPMKVGDVVFSTDRHRVQMINSAVKEQSTPFSTCYLEPRVQLVVQTIGESPQRSMIAEPIGSEPSVPPFCSPGRPVLVHSHQVTLKADLWGRLHDTFTHLFSDR